MSRQMNGGLVRESGDVFSCDVAIMEASGIPFRRMRAVSLAGDMRQVPNVEDW
jgi:hypothetical protein